MNMAIRTPLFTLRSANLSHSDEAQRIDAYVRRASGGTPFHLTGWSRAVAKGCDQRSHYLLAEDGEGMLAGVLPLTEVHSPLFGRALVSSGFAVGGGCACR